MSQHIAKKIKINLKENGSDSTYSDEVTAIQIIYPSNDNVSKNIQILDGSNSTNPQGNYTNIQMLFDQNGNYIDCQTASTPKWETVYSGKASRFSIQDSNANKTIKVNKTGSGNPSDWLQIYPKAPNVQGNVEINQIIIEEEQIPQSNKNIGPDGILQIYPDAKGGTQVYMKDNPDPKTFNVSYGTGSHIPYTKKQEGNLVYFETAGSPITYHSGNAPGRSTRIDTYPGGGMWSNKTTFSWKNNPGYLYNEQGIKNTEYTTFIQVDQDLNTHQAYAHKIGGRDDDTLRSLAEMVYPTATHATVQFNYNYAHFPYVHAEAKQLKQVPKLVPGKWVGVKTIRIVSPDNKSVHWEMWYNESPFDAQGNPQHNWEKIAEYEDKGCKEYGNVPCTWKCHKDVCRVDGFGKVRFAYFSDREIDPNATPAHVSSNASTVTSDIQQQSHIANQFTTTSDVDDMIDKDEAKEVTEYINSHMDIVKEVVKQNPQIASKLKDIYQIDI